MATTTAKRPSLVRPPAGFVGFLVCEDGETKPILADGTPAPPSAVTVATPEAAYALLRDLVWLRKEHFVALYLNARSQLIRRETVSIGTLTASLVHPREVFQPAVECSAACVVIAHNHPSGDPSPSPEDFAITRRLRQCGELMGIEVRDHIIVGKQGFVSLKARGEL